MLSGNSTSTPDTAAGVLMRGSGELSRFFEWEFDIAASKSLLRMADPRDDAARIHGIFAGRGLDPLPSPVNMRWTGGVRSLSLAFASRKTLVSNWYPTGTIMRSLNRVSRLCSCAEPSGARLLILPLTPHLLRMRNLLGSGASEQPGVAYMNQQLFEKALKNFEASIAADPKFNLAD